MNVLPIFANFCFLVELGAPKTPKIMGSWSAGERFVRSPSATVGRHQTLAISPFFAVRSLLLHCTARETDGGITDRVIDAFAPFEGLALRHIEDDRSSCSIGVLAAFDGLCRLCDEGAPRWPMAIENSALQRSKSPFLAT